MHAYNVLTGLQANFRKIEDKQQKINKTVKPEVAKHLISVCKQ